MTQTPTDALRLVPDCSCNRCAQEAVDADGGSPFDPRLVRMFCCIQCGNKRCPHATDHRLSCTGSNEAGQEGSSYVPPLKSAAPASPLPEGGGQLSKNLGELDPRLVEWGYISLDEAITHLGKLLDDQVAFDGLAAPTGDA